MPSSTTRAVNMEIDPNFWDEIAKTSLDFPSAVSELVDNSIANTPKVPGAFNVEVVLSEQAGRKMKVLIADDSVGIPRRRLIDEVFRTGLKGRSSNAVSNKYRNLSEHGFGMKFAVAWLSQHSGHDFELRTASQITGTLETTSVAGALHPGLGWNPIDTSAWKSGTVKCGGPGVRHGTRISVTLPFDQAAQGWIIKHAAPPCSSVNALADNLVEHLGIVYRHLLRLNNNSRMWVSWSTAGGGVQTTQVQPVEIPFISGRVRSRNLTVHSAGRTLKARFSYGEIQSSPLGRVFYRRDQDTQGVDIVCNNKVIQMHAFEPIWRRIGRHNSLNSFNGEIELEGDVMTYIVKNEINWGDPLIIQMASKVEALGSPRTHLSRVRAPPSSPPAIPPPPPTWNFGSLLEDDLRDLLKSRLSVLDPGATVATERETWTLAPGTTQDLPVDIYYEDSGGIVVIETKRWNVEAEDLYQLRMYWDGLEVDGKRPTRAWIIGSGISPAGLVVLNYLNHIPDRSGSSYKISFENWSAFPWPSMNSLPTGPLTASEQTILTRLV